ncbi:hypothetical protein KM043_009532 [Ampulex compressa]|nr:hypothetical protein KM043_009532 [Ampulex compressa]
MYDTYVKTESCSERYTINSKTEKMDKTPVTILQELMVKQLCIPAYEEINKLPERGFVIRVKCKDLCADGTGLNKKEAKHAAAKKMLSLIAENDKSKSIPSTVLPVLNSEHKSLSNTTKAQPCQPQMINYVGLLNEFCAKYKFPSPEYNVNSYGPPFTMTCRVHNIKEEATANNKKEAKQEVSHKVAMGETKDAADLNAVTKLVYTIFMLMQ